MTDAQSAAMGAMQRALTSAPWRALRLEILARDQHACQIRGPDCTRIGTTVDHIIRPADGGSFWDPHNLRAACRTCNSKRGAIDGNAQRRNAFTYQKQIPNLELRW